MTEQPLRGLFRVTSSLLRRRVPDGLRDAGGGFKPVKQRSADMRVIYGLYEAWLTPSFFVERGKAYDPSEPDVASARAKHPDAFGDKFAGADPDDEYSDEAVARRAPGRPRNG
jgi:hypothetical protein